MTQESSTSPWTGKYLKFQLTAWAFFLVVDLFMLAAYANATGPKALKMLTGIVITALASHVILTAALRIGWSAETRGRLLGLVLFACIGGGMLVAWLMIPLERWTDGLVLPAKPGPTGWGAQAMFYTMLLMLWSMFAAAFFFYDLAQQAELERAEFAAAARDAQLHALRLQINPHFLFNSFATLRALVDTDPSLAREAITRLSTMMRYALQSAGARSVSLADELKMVEDYLQLEGLRLGPRLRITAAVEGGLGSLRVPPLCLQMLVENAVKFGAANRREGGDIGYSARQDGGLLHLAVTNPGSIHTPSDSTGLGLSNLRARLTHLYGEAASVSLSQVEPGRIVAELRLPASISIA